MANRWRCCAAFVLSLFFINAFAQKQIPELWGLRVHDEAHVLSPSTVDQLEKQLEMYEDSTSNQIAILIIPSLDGESLEEYSIRVAEKWQLGQKGKDNGVLILVAVDDHKMRIEVGKGLEGVLTDALCSRIIRSEMAPNFRRGDYDAGIRNAVAGITQPIGGEFSGEGAKEFNGDTGLSLTERLLVGLLLFVVLGLFTTVALFSEGCMGWGLYAFLTPFYAVFPWIPLGFIGGVVVFCVYLISFPVFKIIMNRSPKWKSKMMKWRPSGGGSSSGWRSGGWGGGSSRGFSGGGGSFGGGGSSGSW